MKYFTEKAVRVGDVQFIKQKSKFLKAHTSSGHKRSIDELLGKWASIYNKFWYLIEVLCFCVDIRDDDNSTNFSMSLHLFID